MSLQLRTAARARPGAPGVKPFDTRGLAFLSALLLSLTLHTDADAQRRRRAPSGGRVAVVVDERLSALRDAPSFSSNVLRRVGRGRLVAVAGVRESSADGVTFYRVVLTRRTGGWMQSDALVSPARAGDDARLLRLARGSAEFDRAERARIFLETFPRSPLRPAVLLLLAEAAEEAAARLTRDASRRLDAAEMEAGGAPLKSYYLNFNGLDRWRRQGVLFTFDAVTKQFRYDGAAWRELARRHPKSAEAERARARLSASDK